MKLYNTLINLMWQTGWSQPSVIVSQNPQVCHLCVHTCHGLHTLQDVLILDRGTDIMDSAIYCRWVPAHRTSHCVA